MLCMPSKIKFISIQHKNQIQDVQHILNLHVLDAKFHIIHI